ARIARGQEQEHNSMLIHVTRYTAVQTRVVEQVQEELSRLRRAIEFGEGAAKPSIMQQLQDLWKNDYEPTTRRLARPDLPPSAWDAIQQHLLRAVSRIQIKTINGTAKDILDYREHRNGFSVIAVGGDKLSRGLTLEGLSVSYYLRASKMYDTLMQMGRWF